MILPAKQGYMSLCKAAAETATSRQVVGLLDWGQANKNFSHVRPDLLQSFLQILNISMIDATCFVRSLCVLVQVVGADSQERNQEFPIVKDTTPNMMNPRLYTTSYNKP